MKANALFTLEFLDLYKRATEVSVLIENVFVSLVLLRPLTITIPISIMSTLSFCCGFCASAIALAKRITNKVNSAFISNLEQDKDTLSLSTEAIDPLKCFNFRLL